MDLLCCETETVNIAYDDPVLKDTRVFENLLVLEEKYTISSCYFKCLQTELKPSMRKVLADWMMEVCEEECCQEQVFSLSVNILDRFLSLVRVRKTQLQLVGAVCLFLASKLKQSRPVTAERLCLYTDNSVSINELLDWELLVLGRLKWDVSAVTAHDFVRHILRLLPIKDGQDQIRRHAHTFIGLCASDAKFSMYPPSMIAAASIGTAIQGLMPRLGRLKFNSTEELLSRINKITAIDVDCLKACMEQIEETVVERLAAAASVANIPLEVRANQKLAGQDQDPLDQMMATANTPTDVQDVMF